MWETNLYRVGLAVGQPLACDARVVGGNRVTRPCCPEEGPRSLLVEELNRASEMKGSSRGQIHPTPLRDSAVASQDCDPC